MKYALTESGGERIGRAFVNTWGERRLYDSVRGLDRRTVSKILRCEEGVHLSSLRVLFAECELRLEEEDYRPSIATQRRTVECDGSVHDTAAASLCDPASVEPVGGAMPLASPFYLERPEDAIFHAALGRRDGIIRIKGQYQTGKTSLMSRGLDQARQAGAKVIVTDCLRLEPYEKQSLANFYRALRESIADQLESVPPTEYERESLLSAGAGFERYLKREVLDRDALPLVWAIDDADALFALDFHTSVFGLFRSWYNARATHPTAGWDRLTLIITYSTEAHLMIANPNLSPFNVGTRLALHDFTLEQVNDLNRRYGNPLDADAEVPRLYDLVGGHPYLVRCCLFEIAQHGTSLAAIAVRDRRGEGIFGSHLERMRCGIAGDADLATAVQEILRGQTPIAKQSFLRLRSAGVVTGPSEYEARFRCRLFEQHLQSRL